MKTKIAATKEKSKAESTTLDAGTLLEPARQAYQAEVRRLALEFLPQFAHIMISHALRVAEDKKHGFFCDHDITRCYDIMVACVDLVEELYPLCDDPEAGRLILASSVHAARALRHYERAPEAYCVAHDLLDLAAKSPLFPEGVVAAWLETLREPVDDEPQTEVAA